MVIFKMFKKNLINDINFDFCFQIQFVYHQDNYVCNIKTIKKNNTIDELNECFFLGFM